MVTLEKKYSFLEAYIYSVKSGLIILQLFFTVSLLNAQWSLEKDFSPTSSKQAEILIKSFKTCQDIKVGYYEAVSYRKFLLTKDTIVKTYHCYFEKHPMDSISGCFFHLIQYSGLNEERRSIYTGEEFISANVADSIATYYQVYAWEDEVQRLVRQAELYLPFASPSSYPLTEHIDEYDKRETVDWIGDEMISGKTTHHIRLTRMLKDKGGVELRVISNEFHFWIKSDDYVPLAYSVELVAILGNDTLRQSEKYQLTAFQINEPLKENMLSSKSLPSYYRLHPFDSEEMKKNK